jgi:hypothetical protein
LEESVLDGKRGGFSHPFQSDVEGGVRIGGNVFSFGLCGSGDGRFGE